MQIHHTPVLQDTVIDRLKPTADGVYVDGTVGLGGHAAAILEATAPGGRIIGIDLDAAALQTAQQRLRPFGERVILINGNFAEMDNLLEAHAISAVDGILLDIGVSSLQLDTPNRGFSFNHTAPLDMRMDTQTDDLTAMQVIRGSSREELAEIFRRYGEERFAKRIAQRIVQVRAETPITTTTELAEIVKQAVPHGRTKIHPATRVFQALRIHVNAELENLSRGLDTAVPLLKQGGHLCVITFHSLEDRIVKRFFRTRAQTCICPPKTPICICEHTATLEILTKRPICPEAAEVQHNPRARSAKLRVARKL